MKKQIILTWDDESGDGESNEVKTDFFPRKTIDKIESLEVIFGTLANNAKEILEDFNKVGHLENLQGDEKIVHDTCKDIIGIYLDHVAQLRGESIF